LVELLAALNTIGNYALSVDHHGEGNDGITLFLWRGGRSYIAWKGQGQPMEELAGLCLEEMREKEVVTA